MNADLDVLEQKVNDLLVPLMHCPVQRRVSLRNSVGNNNTNNNK
jgi:hypothetical protein